jgi:hypothetical protein
MREKLDENSWIQNCIGRGDVISRKISIPRFVITVH